jgi:hypothetical protein
MTTIIFLLLSIILFFVLPFRIALFTSFFLNFGSMFIYWLKKRKLLFVQLVVVFVFSILFILVYIFGMSEYDVLPYSGMIIYTALFLMGSISLAIKKPFTGHILYTFLWTLSFFVSAISAYIFMPNIWYIFLPFIFTGVTAILNVVLIKIRRSMSIVD